MQQAWHRWLLALVMLPFLAGFAGTGLLLGGVADPCDGFDNDGDGIVDNGCDLVCDAPEVAGPDRKISFVPEVSTGVDMAWNGSQYGLAWVDGRSGALGQCFNILDTAGFGTGAERCVPPFTGSISGVSIAWSGKWGIASVISGQHLSLRTLFPTGSCDAAGCDTIIQSANISGVPSLVWGSELGTGGSESGAYAVAWTETAFLSRSKDVKLILIDQEGNPLSPVVTMDSGGDNSTAPSLAYRQTSLSSDYIAAAWSDSRTGDLEIFFAEFVDVTGPRRLFEVQVTHSPGQSVDPSVVWTGTEYGLAWRDNRDDLTEFEVYFVRLDTSGDVIGSEVRVTNSSRNVTSAPALIWTGSEYQLSWGTFDDFGQSDVYFGRIDAQGNPLGNVNVTGITSGGSPKIAWSGSESLVAYASLRPVFTGDTNIYTTPLRCCDDQDGDGFTECRDPNDADPLSFPGAVEICDAVDNNGDGTVDEGCDGECTSPQAGGTFIVSDESAGAGFPSLAWNGSGLGAAWSETGTLFRPLDAVGAPVGLAESIASGVPSLVWNGSEYGLLSGGGGGPAATFSRIDLAGSVVSTTVLPGVGSNGLVWNGSKYGALNSAGFFRIDAQGNQLGTPIPLPPFGFQDLAWSGSEYALVGAAGFPQGRGVHFQRLDPLGNAVGSVLEISPDDAREAEIVWDGSGYGLSWTRTASVPSEVIFVRLDPAGAVLVPETVIASGSFNAGSSSLVWTGEEYGIAYSQICNACLNPVIRLATVDPTGIITSDISVSPFINGAESSARPSLVWTGTEYVVAYEMLHFPDPFEPVEDWEIWVQPVPCCGNDLDGDGSGNCADCNIINPDVYPGAPGLCDGLNNDCNHPNYPSLPGTEEFDDDADGMSECQGDCDDSQPAAFLGNPEVCDNIDNDCNGTVDGFASSCGTGACAATGTCAAGVDSCTPGTPSPEICDGLDNDCDGLIPADENDLDLDGFLGCVDCNDADPATYPGALEINDGKDNQCPGYAGFGLVDEISGSTSIDPATQEFCWRTQCAATDYQVARATSPDFSTGCTTSVIPGPDCMVQDTTCLTDLTIPSSGEVSSYVVRPLGLFAGSWGAASNGAERFFVCGTESICDDGVDDDLDGLTDCVDPDCSGISGCELGTELTCGDGIDNDGDGVTDCADPDCVSTCLPVTFAYIDTAGDDLASTDFFDFFTDNAVGSSDYLYLEFAAAGGLGAACFERADFYRDNYLVLAPSAGMVVSGTWNKWFKSPFTGGAWVLNGSGFSNQFGTNCFGAYAWCPASPAIFPGTAVRPGATSTCEAYVAPAGGCGDGTWMATVRLGSTRLEACGF